MSHHSPHINADELLQLSEQVNRIAGSLAKLSHGLGDEESQIGVPSDSEASQIDEAVVRWVINARNVRARFLPSDLFADPVWDMLLELFRAELAQQRISVSSLCIAANVPSTTALRYINTMVQRGMINREPDRCDGRRVYVSLAPQISKALCSYFINVIQRPVARKAVTAPQVGRVA